MFGNVKIFANPSLRNSNESPKKSLSPSNEASNPCSWKFFPAISLVVTIMHAGDIFVYFVTLENLMSLNSHLKSSTTNAHDHTNTIFRLRTGCYLQNTDVIIAFHSDMAALYVFSYKSFWIFLFSFNLFSFLLSIMSIMRSLSGLVEAT